MKFFSFTKDREKSSGPPSETDVVHAKPLEPHRRECKRQGRCPQETTREQAEEG